MQMVDSQTWYIVKRPTGQCEIIYHDQVEKEEESVFEERWGPFESQQDAIARWGPFESQQDAIARRVGLIRSGKCKPS
jgi:hypothetical protein